MDEARLDDLALTSRAAAERVAQVRAARSPLNRADALIELSETLLSLGQAEDARACAQRAHELAGLPLRTQLRARVTDRRTSRRGRDRVSVEALLLEGRAELALARCTEAIKPLTYATRWFAMRGDTSDARRAADSLASALAGLGRYDEAEGVFETGAVEARARGDEVVAQRWEDDLVRHRGWFAADPATLAEIYDDAARRTDWRAVGYVGILRAQQHKNRGDEASACELADAATAAYRRLPPAAGAPLVARARWEHAWCLPDDHPEKVERLVRARRDLLDHDDGENAKRCREDLLSTIVRQHGWAAAAAWIADRWHVLDVDPVLTGSPGLSEIWEPQTTAERARHLLGDVSAETDDASLLQAIAVVEIRWGEAELGAELLDRAVDIADAEGRVVMEHDRAVLLLSRGDVDAGRASLQQAIRRAADHPDGVRWIGGLHHELASSHGRAGEREAAREHYELAAQGHRARLEQTRRRTYCAIHDSTDNLMLLDGAEPRSGTTAFSSGGWSMSWCRCWLCAP